MSIHAAGEVMFCSKDCYNHAQDVGNSTLVEDLMVWLALGSTMELRVKRLPMEQLGQLFQPHQPLQDHRCLLTP